MPPFSLSYRPFSVSFPRESNLSTSSVPFTGTERTPRWRISELDVSQPFSQPARSSLARRWGKVVPYRMSGGDWGLRRPRSAPSVSSVSPLASIRVNRRAEKVGRQAGRYRNREKEKPAIGRRASQKAGSFAFVVIVGVNLRKGTERSGRWTSTLSALCEPLVGRSFLSPVSSLSIVYSVPFLLLLLLLPCPPLSSPFFISCDSRIWLSVYGSGHLADRCLYTNVKAPRSTWPTPRFRSILTFLPPNRFPSFIARLSLSFPSFLSLLLASLLFFFLLLPRTPYPFTPHPPFLLLPLLPLLRPRPPLRQPFPSVPLPPPPPPPGRLIDIPPSAFFTLTTAPSPPPRVTLVGQDSTTHS